MKPFVIFFLIAFCCTGAGLFVLSAIFLIISAICYVNDNGDHYDDDDLKPS